ncbi:MAG TPA: hypothetical protein VMW41_02415 [Candidatus Bathyarchaeia archaeon]|nr:hypothetical protein [Candidatus Bathyarchaeia archaeon]
MYKLKNYWKLYLLLILPMLVISLIYLRLVPFGQTPDEPAHIAYIKYIAENHQIPTLEHLGLAHHPPFYYLLLTPVYMLTRNLLFLRLASLIFSLVNVLVIYQYTFFVFSKKADIAKGTALISSLIPMYAFMSIAVNNDSLSNLFASFIIYFSLIGLQRQLNKKEFILWCLLLFSSVFTKIVLFPIVFISICLLFWHQKAKRKSILLSAITLGLLLYILWFSRNIRLYGDGDILGWQALKKVNPDLVGNQLIRNSPRQWSVLFFHSFWGVFGWFAIYLPVMIYSALRKLTLLLFPFLVWYLVKIRKKLTGFQKKSLSLLCLFLSIVLAAIIRDNFIFFHPSGRYLFPVIGIVALYYSLSIYSISLLVSRFIGKRFQKLIYYVFIILPLAYINIISIIKVSSYF